MKIRSIASLFFVFGMISFSVAAEDKNVLPHDAPSDAAATSKADAESSAAKNAVVQGVPATDTAQKNSSSSGAVPGDAPAKADVVRVPYVPQVVMREIKEEIRQEVLAQAKGERWGDPGAMPDWLSRISWDGDFRVRYQRDGFPVGNTPPAQYNPSVTSGGNSYVLHQIDNTTDTHNYMRVQVHLGMKAKVSDYTFAAFRLSTGTTSNPVSTNQTLGTGFNKSSLVLDRAYMQSSPYYWLAFSAGKMPNPWLSTDLVWDSDVNFEGAAAQLKPRFGEEWSGFLTAGAFPFQDIQRSDTVLANSKWLYGTQLSARWTAMDSSTAQFGVALYDFKNVEGTPNATLGSHFYDTTAAQSMQKGNSLMYVNATGDPAIYGIASKFRELNYTARMDWATFDPVHVMLSGDYVKNLGFDADEIAQRTGQAAQAPKVTGYQAALAVGYSQVKQRGDWQASVAYKYLERDAVLDALTDSDFHLGGTNAKGFVIGGSYGLDKGTSLGLRWISADQIDGPPLSIDTLQVDLNLRF